MRIRISQSKAGTRGGFSLLEVMTGMMVVGVLVMALYAGISTGFGTVQASRENLRATQIVLDQMELLRLTKFEDLESFVMDPEPYDYTDPAKTFYFNGTVTVAPSGFSESYAADVKAVTVELTWESQGKGVKRTRSMFTFVTKNGLQAYAF